MDLLEDLRMSVLNFNFAMIFHIIHKILALVKNYLNYLKDSIFECFFNCLKKILFTTNNNGKFKS